MIWTITQVALGGAIGALGRFGMTHGIARLTGGDFPYGTALVNISGCFLMGFLFVMLESRGLSHHAPLLLAGVLGGFTTFSAFSLDAFRLWEGGGILLAAIYVLGSVTLSIAALALGIISARAMA